ncbi:MAG: protein translocase subunit SecD [Lachnospiraceae bacterium]|nr:protein translocase subunit SecD [Lachnospiraceae bacterium]
MKKSSAVVSLLLMLALMAGCVFTLVFGLGKKGDGAIANTKLGLDLAGGVSITYEVVGDEKPSREAVEDTIYKLRQRIDKYSTESQVYQEGDNRISIEIPGVTDAEAILAELGSPGSLYFIRSTAPNGGLNYYYAGTKSGYQIFEEDNVKFVRTENGSYLYDAETNDIKYEGESISENAVPYTIQNNAAVNTVYALTRPLEDIIADGSAIFDGTGVSSSSARAHTNDYNQVENVVALSLTDEAAKIFAEETRIAATKQDLYRTIAIYYDGELISVPRVNEAITGGQCTISGMANQMEAERLASFIRIGGLSLELQELRSNVVGAQLGGEAISTSIKAGIIGVSIVIVFMIAVYFVPGLCSSIALLLYIMLDLICINFLGLTLTLPGIAGFILSIGMAVDANVIIFARIREEIASGSSVENAIKAGFSKALSAILDGNITTLIAAIVLMAMGSGSIKGFAYTLALGIVLSMLTALFITKLFIKAFYALGVQDAKWYGKGKERKTINFLGKKKFFFGTSIGVIVIGIAAMVIFGVTSGKSLNFSLDFMGGSATTVTFEEEMSRDVVDTEIVPKFESIIGDANVQWTSVDNSNAIIFKTNTLSGEQREEIDTMLEKDYGVSAEQITTESISSTISSEMQRDAIVAVLVAALCMLIYIWFRFSDVRFGASAVVALLHDVLVTLTFYALVRLSVGSTFIACMLTIVGYSINATIVIFDRIRENRKLMKKKETLEDMVNKSISQTLSRSIFTSLTTFIMVAVLYILGVSSIREFALPLIIGILCGTYSSVCVTGALWTVLSKKWPQTEEDD